MTTTTPARRERRPRDLVTGLIVVVLVALVALIPAVVAYDATGRMPAWWWLPLALPAGLLAVLVTNWCRGDYLPPPVDHQATGDEGR